MALSVSTAWRARRRCVAAGFLVSTSLFLLLAFLNWRNEHRGMSMQKATGLSATASWDLRSAWSQGSLLPISRSKQRVRKVDFAENTIGGVPGGVPPAPFARRTESPTANEDRQVIQSGTLEITVLDPLQIAEQLRNLATQLSGFVVSSKVSGSDQRTRSAQVTMRIPTRNFYEAGAQVKAIAKSVEQDVVEARDVTREYVDQEAALHNARAEEQQYLLILKRASSVKDVLEVSSKLAEVRAHIDEIQGDLRFVRQQVDMSLLTINITAMADVQVLGIRWRPLYKAKLAFRGALSGLADYGDSMMALVVNLPVIAIWAFTIVAFLKVGWIAARRIVLLFFPALGTWLHRPREAT